MCNAVIKLPSPYLLILTRYPLRNTHNISPDPVEHVLWRSQMERSRKEPTGPFHSWRQSLINAFVNCSQQFMNLMILFIKSHSTPGRTTKPTIPLLCEFRVSFISRIDMVIGFHRLHYVFMVWDYDSTCYLCFISADKKWDAFIRK